MDNENSYDKIMCVNAYLVEKYGGELLKEFGYELTGDNQKDMFVLLKVFGEIYRKVKEKYPNIWYEYVCCR